MIESARAEKKWTRKDRKRERERQTEEKVKEKKERKKTSKSLDTRIPIEPWPIARKSGSWWIAFVPTSSRSRPTDREEVTSCQRRVRDHLAWFLSISFHWFTKPASARNYALWYSFASFFGLFWTDELHDKIHCITLLLDLDVLWVHWNVINRL